MRELQCGLYVDTVRAHEGRSASRDIHRVRRDQCQHNQAIAHFHSTSLFCYLGVTRILRAGRRARVEKLKVPMAHCTQCEWDSGFGEDSKRVLKHSLFRRNQTRTWAQWDGYPGGRRRAGTKPICTGYFTARMCKKEPSPDPLPLSPAPRIPILQTLVSLFTSIPKDEPEYLLWIRIPVDFSGLHC